MTYLELISEIGNQFIVNLYLQGKISYLELSQEIGNSKADLVQNYKMEGV